MIRLNPEQKTAVDHDGNVVVTACPGSGKTRVLSARVIRGLLELSSKRGRVVALTFTNRAADEIQMRLDLENVPTECLWAGTIHGFALQWILRPYAPYCDVTRRGFAVSDEFYTGRLLDEIKADHKLEAFADINTGIDRNGETFNLDNEKQAVFERYKEELRRKKLIDYDDVLYLAYRILQDNTEIAATLGSIIRLICVDEVQDVQDLQYGILSTIYRASASPPAIFLVGDANQSIYESLGALTKTPAEIAAEFGLDTIAELELHGNYRSTQRIIDLYVQLRPSCGPIRSLTQYADQAGVVTFDDQTIAKDDLPRAIAELILNSIRGGVEPKDICVLAPHWWHVRALARRLVTLLPNVDFDAPGLSPLYSSRDNFWFKVARLFLTTPSPSRTRTRIRWATEVIADLGAFAKMTVPAEIGTPRRLLRLINGIVSAQVDGLAYLRDVFGQFLNTVGLSLDSNSAVAESFATFFEKAEAAIAGSDGGVPGDVASFRKLFRHPAGVVVSTCHAVKGEEYETVVAFGLLRGYIPHWSSILHQSGEAASDRESKLLYVICSRAKRRLHLIAECGRTTQRGRPYETSKLVKAVRFHYD